MEILFEKYYDILNDLLKVLRERRYYISKEGVKIPIYNMNFVIVDEIYLCAVEPYELDRLFILKLHPIRNEVLETNIEIDITYSTILQSIDILTFDPKKFYGEIE